MGQDLIADDYGVRAVRAAMKRGLVDSSVWIDLLRERETPATNALRELIALDGAALAPVIYQEILQGAASRKAFSARRAGAALPSLPNGARTRHAVASAIPHATDDSGPGSGRYRDALPAKLL